MMDRLNHLFLLLEDFIQGIDTLLHNLDLVGLNIHNRGSKKLNYAFTISFESKWNHGVPESSHGEPSRKYQTPIQIVCS